MRKYVHHKWTRAIQYLAHLETRVLKMPTAEAVHVYNYLLYVVNSFLFALDFNGQLQVKLWKGLTLWWFYCREEILISLNVVFNYMSGVILHKL